MKEAPSSEAAIKKYTVAGGDDACYGPRFGPITANEVGRFGNGGSECLVLRLAAPVQDGSTTAELIAIRPRYQGVNFESLQKNETTVGVWLLTSDNPQSFQTGLTEENSKYWAIGTCILSEA